MKDQPSRVRMSFRNQSKHIPYLTLIPVGCGDTGCYTLIFRIILFNLKERDIKGIFVLPTVFADVTNDMAIAQEEIFGPVLSMIKYSSIDQAIEIANDTPYGLAAAVWAGDRDKAKAIAKKIKAGQCAINGGEANHEAPFGGYKESGNGREFGDAGLHEYCEIKAMQF